MEYVVRDSDDDPISPTRIVHDVDEIFPGTDQEQIYNFIDYSFEKYGAFCRARTYLTDIKSVFLDGPFTSPDSEEEVECPELREEVLTYLKRRFMMIDVPGDKEHVTIWRHPKMDPRD